MGRHKTIPDREVLEVARGAFRRSGFAVSGREIARLAGVSEAVLYQRFESKDSLFFAAMSPTAPDILELLGPKDPPGDALEWIRHAVEGITAYFEELLPLAIQVTLHPGHHGRSIDEAGHVAIADRILEELALRLRSLQKRAAITDAPHQLVARLLVGIAHDRALHRAVLAPRSHAGQPSLAPFVDLAWRGLAPPSGSTAKGRPTGSSRARRG